jgi:hypothetical protein
MVVRIIDYFKCIARMIFRECGEGWVGGVHFRKAISLFTEAG